LDPISVEESYEAKPDHHDVFVNLLHLEIPLMLMSSLKYLDLDLVQK
jgi:hypothetical protein